MRLGTKKGQVQLTNLIKHVSQVILGVDPRCHGITEKNKVLKMGDRWHIVSEISKPSRSTLKNVTSPAPPLQG